MLNLQHLLRLRNMFKKFEYIPNYDYTNGWDRYALDYQNLLVKDTIYYLTKEMMHLIVDKEIGHDRKDISVLDVNCGTGNDFPFFFNRCWQVDGCDGSPGMLNKAAENYGTYIDGGQLQLYAGMLEELKNDTFPKKKYDLIFSVTGGFSYVDDMQLKRINEKLKGYLKNDGKMILAHLNYLCFPEMIYRALKMQNPFYRLKTKLKVNIKNEEHTMHLRNTGKLKKIYHQHFSHLKLYPLLAFTPPYQTHYKPSRRVLDFFKKTEKKLLNLPGVYSIADQIVVVCKK